MKLEKNETKEFRMLLAEVRQAESAGGSYCLLTFKDEEGETIPAKFWKTTRDKIVSVTPEMSPVRVTLKGDEYRGNMQYIVSKLEPDPERKASDYAVRADIPGNEAVYKILKIVDRLADSPVKAICQQLYAENEQQLDVWPAAMNIHGAYLGGLAMHSYMVVKGAAEYAALARPEKMEALKHMEPKAALQGAFSCIKACGRTDITKAAMRVYQHKLGHVEEAERARKVLFATRLAAALADGYPKDVRKDLVVSATALRGASLMAAMDMAKAVGTHAADVLLLRETVGAETADTEDIRLLSHSVLAEYDEYKGVDAVCAEAFLASACEQMAELAYTADPSFDADLLVAAAALHDIGKLKELDANELGIAEYNVEGNLFGHAMIGLRMIADAAKSQNIPLASITKLLHCVAAHHGKTEWGALTEPSCPEAKALALIDLMDSRVDAYGRRARNLAPGEKDESMRKILGNVIYRPKEASKATAPGTETKEAS